MAEEQWRHRRGGVETALRTSAVWASVRSLIERRQGELDRPLRVLDLGGGTGGLAVRSPRWATGSPSSTRALTPWPRCPASAERRPSTAWSRCRATSTRSPSFAGGPAGRPGLCHGRSWASTTRGHPRRPGRGTSTRWSAQPGCLATPAVVLPGAVRPPAGGQALEAPTAAGAATTRATPFRRRPLQALVGDRAGLEDVQGVRVFSDLVPWALLDSDADGIARSARWPRPTARLRPPGSWAPPCTCLPDADGGPALTRGHRDEPATYAFPGARRPRPGRHRVHRAARRHGRVLRLGVPARAARAGRGPVIVGGSGSRGVVLSATYEARTFGVPPPCRWPGRVGCAPTATVVAPDLTALQAVSAGVMAIFHDHDPGGRAAVPRRGLPRRVRGGAAARTPGRIGQLHPQHGWMTSRGLRARWGWRRRSSSPSSAPASKPDGMVVMPPDEVVSFLHALPVGALWGVGDKTEEALLRLGLHTVGDIAHAPRRHLAAGFGPSRRPAPARAVVGSRPPARCRPASRSGASGRRTFASTSTTRTRSTRSLLKLASGPRLGCVRPRGGPDHLDPGAVRRLHHPHPRPHPARPDRHRPRDLRHRLAPLRALGLQRARLRLVGVRVEGLAESEGRPHPAAPWTSPATGGVTPTGRSTRPARDSGRAVSARPA